MDRGEGNGNIEMLPTLTHISNHIIINTVQNSIDFIIIIIIIYFLYYIIFFPSASCYSGGIVIGARGSHLLPSSIG